MKLQVNNETSLLKSVILGRSSIGVKPLLSDTYDATSYNAVLNNNYPRQVDVKKEMISFELVLKKYGIKVYKPSIIKNCNQIFARDVSFVIDDLIINPNIISNRTYEKNAYEKIYAKISYNKIFNLPPKAFVEGGDVILYNDIVFIGVYCGSDFDQVKTARTNLYGYNYLKDILPHKKFILLELKKNDKNPLKGVLHLDCAFMPVAKNKAIVCKDAFVDIKDYHKIVDVFGTDNLFEITKEEQVKLFSNVFSISPSIVVSEYGFDRLNNYLEKKWGLIVERVPYSEISKMGGLFRCSTHPLEREKDYE